MTLQKREFGTHALANTYTGYGSLYKVTTVA